jgi:hypothetical protein
MLTVDEMKEHLRISGRDEDSYLAALEAAAVQFVETQTRRSFTLRTVTDYRSPIGSSMYLSDMPTGAVTVNRRYSATAEPVEVAATEFAVRGQKLVRPLGWRSGEYEVTYNAGYPEGTAPEDIKGLVRDLVALAYRARGGIEGDIGGFAGIRLSDVDSILGLRDTLRAYSRKPSFGIA